MMHLATPRAPLVDAAGAARFLSGCYGLRPVFVGLSPFPVFVGLSPSAVFVGLTASTVFAAIGLLFFWSAFGQRDFWAGLALVGQERFGMPNRYNKRSTSIFKRGVALRRKFLIGY